MPHWKDFAEVLVCRLQPQGREKVLEPQKIEVTIIEKRQDPFYISGSSSLGNFTFMVSDLLPSFSDSLLKN